MNTQGGGEVAAGGAVVTWCAGMRDVELRVRSIVEALAHSGFALHALALAMQAFHARRRLASPLGNVARAIHYEQPLLELRWRNDTDRAEAALNLARLLEDARRQPPSAAWREALAHAVSSSLSAQTVLAWRAHVAERLLRRKTFQGVDFGWPDHAEPSAVCALVAATGEAASDLGAVLERVAGPCYVRMRPVVEWYLRHGVGTGTGDEAATLPPFDADAAAAVFQAARRAMVAFVAEGHAAALEPELAPQLANELRRRLAASSLRHLAERRVAFCRELVGSEEAALAFASHQRRNAESRRGVRRGRSARWDTERCDEFARALVLRAAHLGRGDARQAAAVEARTAAWLERNCDWTVLAQTENWERAAETSRPVSAETIRRLGILRRRVERLEGRLVLEHEALVLRAARPWLHTSFRDDALQIGRVELLRTLRQYDPEHGALSTYALRCISAALRRPMAAMMQSVSASANDRRFHHRIHSLLATEEAAETISDAELSRRAGVPIERVRVLRKVHLVAEEAEAPALDALVSDIPPPDESLVRREQARTAAARVSRLLDSLSEVHRIAIAAETDLLSLRDAVDRWVSSWLAGCRERAANWRPYSPA